MRPPLYALLLSPDPAARRAVEEGRKAITVREGHRDYRPDKPVMLCCHIEPWCLMADITEVRHCRLAQVTDEEIRDDGYADLDAMLADLRRFYPAIGPDSPVTVIRWSNVRGLLARTS